MKYNTLLPGRFTQALALLDSPEAKAVLPPLIQLPVTHFFGAKK